MLDKIWYQHIRRLYKSKNTNASTPHSHHHSLLLTMKMTHLLMQFFIVNSFFHYHNHSSAWVFKAETGSVCVGCSRMIGTSENKPAVVQQHRQQGWGNGTALQCSYMGCGGNSCFNKVIRNRRKNIKKHQSTAACCGTVTWAMLLQCSMSDRREVGTGRKMSEKCLQGNKSGLWGKHRRNFVE